MSAVGPEDNGHKVRNLCSQSISCLMRYTHTSATRTSWISHEQGDHGTDLPKKGKGHDDLKRGRPQHVQESGEVHEALGIHRHQVDHLSHCRGPLRFIGNNQWLYKKKWLKKESHHIFAYLCLISAIVNKKQSWLTNLWHSKIFKESIWEDAKSIRRCCSEWNCRISTFLVLNGKKLFSECRDSTNTPVSSDRLLLDTFPYRA